MSAQDLNASVAEIKLKMLSVGQLKAGYLERKLASQ